jgi:hypothetical protein
MSSSVDREGSVSLEHSTVTWRSTAWMVQMKLAAVSEVMHTVLLYIHLHPEELSILRAYRIVHFYWWCGFLQRCRVTDMMHVITTASVCRGHLHIHVMYSMFIHILCLLFS